jgi:urea transporter
MRSSSAGDRGGTSTTPSRNRLRDVSGGILSGYSQIYFSRAWYAGLFFMAATFVVPEQGAVGLGSLLLSNLWARALGFSREHVREGYYAYNGLLTGLALGLTFRINGAFLVLLPLSALIGVLIAASLRFLYERYLFIPVLSLPFVLTSWVVIAGCRQFQGLHYLFEPYQIVFRGLALSGEAGLFVRSLGAAFFQINNLSGILVAVGLLLFSRYAFLLAVAGLAAGSAVYVFLRGYPEALTTGLIGFNFALTAIAVGGVWSVPGPDSLLLAVLGGALSALVAAAFSHLLGLLDLVPLAFPFVATTCLMLCALRFRGSATRFRLVSIPEETPEKNLKREKNLRARFVTGEVPVFLLPVSGEWLVSQAFNGESTHKERWAHAWDFEIMDGEGKKWKSAGDTVEDYHAYNMPVFAPADGKVVAVVNHVEDNPVGLINAEQNWGNAVVILHQGPVYSTLCHLKQNSVSVDVGETVKPGQMIGRVGNSGRSPVPHVHFQAQISHDLGAPTIPSELMHYVQADVGGPLYRTHGCPVKGDRVRPLVTSRSALRAAGFPVGERWRFRAWTPEKLWEEEWTSDIDLEGNRYLMCREPAARIRIFVHQKVLLLLDYDGPRGTGLYWFYAAVPRLPMTREAVHWRDRLPGGMLLTPPGRFLFDLFEPFFSIATLHTSSRILDGENGLAVRTSIHSKRFPRGAAGARINAEARFRGAQGLLSLSLERGSRPLFRLEQEASSDPTPGRLRPRTGS